MRERGAASQYLSMNTIYCLTCLLTECSQQNVSALDVKQGPSTRPKAGPLARSLAKSEEPCHDLHVCYTGKAPNAWHRRGTQKTGNTYNQPKRPSTDTHRPSTKHYRKGSQGVKAHNTNQHSSRARLQHRDHAPSSPSPNRFITGSSQPTQPLRSAGGLSRTTPQTPPASARTRSSPLRLGGPSSGVADGQPRAHGLLLRRGRGAGGRDERCMCN